ncbi:MAG: hypothetical protein GC168_00715 [Candidatus Hydrogenedens sp.]|nr:hypothetical protein [Candidatus Hydrogenedens sp.]
MVDKLRKAGLWVWANKERMILLVMVVLLCRQVYAVVYPPEPEQEASLPLPRTPDPADLPPEVDPPSPEPISGLRTPGEYVNLYRKNPFWYYSTRSEGATGSDSDTLNIQLLDIRVAGSRVTARLKTNAATKWYVKGDKFEEYQLLDIDPEAGTVEIYSESKGTQETLQKQ